MKQEKTSGMNETSENMLLIVEPGDERVHILAALAHLAGQRVIVALPGDTVFHRPGDLRELKQAAAHANIELTLVIASNERLRLWARAQGFSVFSSLETCTRSRLPGVALLPTPAVSNSGQFKVPGVPMTRQAPRITEPLYTRTVAPRVASAGGERAQANAAYASMYTHMQAHVAVDVPLADSQLTETPVDMQLIDVQKALHRQIAGEKAQDRLAQPLSLLSSAELSVPARAEMQPEGVGLSELPTWEATRTIWHDRLLFILVALLALGIMGGLSFGYLLSLSHSATLAVL